MSFRTAKKKVIYIFHKKFVASFIITYYLVFETVQLSDSRYRLTNVNKINEYKRG